MKFVIDFHVHTISSGDAFGTINEVTYYAKLFGMEMIAITDHGPNFNGSSGSFYFGNLPRLPAYINGVHVLKSVELNIIDYDGNYDLSDEILSELDFVIVGFHECCISPKDIDSHTKAIKNILRNPLIDCIAHVDRMPYDVNFIEVIESARKYNKFIEINSSSLKSSGISRQRCIDLIKCCVANKVKIICGSDAHSYSEVGSFKHVIELLEELEVPQYLIMNTSTDAVEKYIIDKKRSINKIKKSHSSN